MNFTGIKLLVIGDIMLDKHIRGMVERLNPESPVPLIDVREEEYAPGGAANTAANVASLGGEAYMLGVIGKDKAGEQLIHELKSRGINTDYIIAQENNSTIVKVRVYAQTQQLIRFDYEKKYPISHENFSNLAEIVEKVDNIIISDYAKGLITPKLMDKLRTFDKKIIIDPKPANKEMYSDMFLLTPNAKEACKLAGLDYSENVDYQLVGNMLRDKYNSNVLITRGDKGMSLFNMDNNHIHLETVAKEVYDVTGAGDTVIAALALCIAKGYTLKESAQLANKAAAIAVSKAGTASVTIEELINIY